MGNTLRGLRSIFSLRLGEKPELVYQSGVSPSKDEGTRKLVNAIAADLEAAMEKVGGLLVLATDFTEKGRFQVKVVAPGRRVLAIADNVFGETAVDISLDPIAVAIWLFGNGYKAQNREEVAEIGDILKWIDAALVNVVDRFAPVPDAPEQQPEPTPVDEPEKCKNCPAEIKAVCIEVRQTLGIE
jgi:hypothetical protein